MLFNILFTIFVLLVATACLAMLLSVAPFLDEMWPLRAPAVFGGWMFSIVMLLSAFNVAHLFYIHAFAAVPWPWVFCFVCIFIPVVNAMRTVSIMLVLSVVVFILKVYWKYQS